MQFPPDTSLYEMQLLLSQLWIGYLPGTDYSFLKELDEMWCNLILKLITTKDISKREELWHEIDQLIIKWRHNIDILLHQAENIMLEFRENLWKEEDNQSILKLEEMIKDM